MIDVQTSRDGDLVTAVVAGAIDTRGAGDFERALLKSVEEGGRRIVVDFGGVDLLTSAGIRVLVTLTRRLQGAGGALVLCGLGPAVQRVFEISGLTNHFRIAATRADAAAALGSAKPVAQPQRSSRLSQIVGSLLGGRGSAEPQGGPSNAPSARKGAAAGADPARKPQSRLSTQVVRLLAARPGDRRK